MGIVDMKFQNLLAGAGLASGVTLGLAASANAGAPTIGNISVTYYLGDNTFSNTEFTDTGAGITFNEAPSFTDSISTISETADYGGANSDPAWPGGTVSFAADFTGTITASKAGTYGFSFGADDAAYLFVDGSSAPLASFVGGNDFEETGAPKVFDLTLNQGANAFEIQYANEVSNQAAILFQAAAVPEPATWAMMLAGFGGLGVAMRSRRKTLPAVA
jgi:hypothetical protein